MGGILWLLFWWYVGIPVLSVLLGGLCCGFLFTAVIFNLTPLGKFHFSCRTRQTHSFSVIILYMFRQKMVMGIFDT